MSTPTAISPIPPTTSASAAVHATQSRVDFATLNPGQHLSEIQYYEVISKTPTHAVLKNERGILVEIHKDIINEGMYSADYVNDEETITQTQAAERFESFGAEVLQVNYTKKADKESIANVLAAFKSDNSISGSMLNLDEKELTSLMKSALKGNERTLTGYVVSREQKLGRVQMIDLNLPATEKHRNRLVDLRTINWFIHKGVKYTVKRS